MFAMESEKKVFSSSIIRTQNNLKNNLYDILNTIPALPKADDKELQNSECSFTPKNDKYYVSKKKNGSKVKTVREIRNIFESDVYSYLFGDLEKQKTLLLRKFRHGFSRDAKTKEIAENMQKSCNPISKSAWEMLMNINPKGHKFPSQYVLYNGKYIRVNGSRGGSTKFLYKYDISKKKETLNKLINKKRNCTRKKGLLQNSLNVKFKPGPLTKKKRLDTSFQKHHFGEMELITLPKPGLDISPTYNKPLAPSINSFLQDAFVVQTNGLISQKWADFAVSMLGSNKNGTAIQLKENCNVTFDLDYKCYQNRILMRKDSDIATQERFNNTVVHKQEQDESVILSEVRNIIYKIIDTVEISLTQNELFCGEDELREENTVKINSQIKDKTKRKYGELDRLDVTVIRIPDSSECDSNYICRNAYCALGCICDSLKTPYNFKTHCGHIECMFHCKCDFSKYKLSDALNSDSADIIRGLVNLDKKLGQTLAKEEHKFHQTVVVTDEKSILLNSRKRNWKTSKKYAEFYCGMQLKSECDIKKNISVVCTDLKIKNVEPWCMIHNLYKCFCKGKFTKTSLEFIEKTTDCNKVIEKCIDFNLKSREGLPLEPISKKRTITDENELSFDSTDYDYSARTMPYEGRKYNDEYYQSTNTKISEMEQNDQSLRKKLINLINIDESQDNNRFENIDSPDTPYGSFSVDEFLDNAEEKILDDVHDVKQLSSQKLVKWLEYNYKKYKALTNHGSKKPSLYPPRPGNMALYPWDFILGRYREKKNHFLISKQSPYRIFMAVDTKNSLFDNCININDIALSDLDKYPVTVKNLLTNATDLTDNFCILCGLSNCWELVGSVTKVNNKPINTSETDKLITFDEKSQADSVSDLEYTSVFTENSSDELNNTTTHVAKALEKNTEHSKWFVMTIENDFTEIQFYKRGFFVKYESIIKAINVAKVSGKTVKLSSQNCPQRQNISFGIYAVPSDKDNYVFIGPYEKDDSLGIETIKSMQDTRKIKRTRGTWITTNKIDDIKVIDNPLLYMPSKESCNKSLLISSQETNHQELCDKNISTNISPQKDNKGTIKPIKPITVRKTNFYQLAPNGLFKQVPVNNKVNMGSQSLLLNSSLLVNKNASSSKSPLLNLSTILSHDLGFGKVTEKKVLPQSLKPVAEIAPQIKENMNVVSSSDARKREGSMFVLKPEEINKRSFQNELLNVQPQATTSSNKNEMEMDIENFLNSFVICEEPKDVCYIISDDEDDNYRTKEEDWKNVWIVCKNIDNLGWIPGRRNENNHLSFEFPGFKYSDFYNEEEAFEKISQVLSRKIYVPKHLNLEWEARESLSDIVIKDKLTAHDLATDYVLTKKGLRHKSELLNKLKSLNSVKSSDEGTSSNESRPKDNLLTEKNIIIEDLEETSKTLEEESLYLLEKMSKKGETLESFTRSWEDRKELSEQLNNIKITAERSE